MNAFTSLAIAVVSIGLSIGGLGLAVHGAIAPAMASGGLAFVGMSASFTMPR